MNIALQEKKDFNNHTNTKGEKSRAEGKNLVESLHVMFSLYHVFANNQSMAENI